MKRLGIFLLLSALAATGYSLVCKSCTDSSDKPCNETKKCSDDEACVFIRTSMTMESKTNEQYTITCGKLKNCNISGSMSYKNGKILMATTCCHKDNCTVPFPALPTESTKPNNHTCETCASDKDTFCYSLEQKKCTGEETRCGHTKLKLSGKEKLSEGAHGCATESFCEKLGNQYTDINGLTVELKTVCGAAELRVGYFAVIFIAVLTKFMF